MSYELDLLVWFLYFMCYVCVLMGECVWVDDFV